jgi:hypothetical protein
MLRVQQARRRVCIDHGHDMTTFSATVTTPRGERIGAYCRKCGLSMYWLRDDHGTLSLLGALATDSAPCGAYEVRPWADEKKSHA